MGRVECLSVNTEHISLLNAHNVFCEEGSVPSGAIGSVVAPWNSLMPVKMRGRLSESQHILHT